MKRLIAFALVIVSLLITIAFAETPDYSFLDGMSLSELEALQIELNKRIANEKKANASADPTNLGMWESGYYVDEFNLPTDKKYIRNTQYIKGTFSNSATTNSKLNVAILVDDDDVAFKLYEYGDMLVKNAYSRYSQYYSVTMMDNDGKRSSLEGYYYPNGDRMYFDQKDEQKIIKALSANGTVRFSIKENNGSSSYLFAIQDTSNFSNAYKLVK